MTTWWTADLHIGHDNIRRYSGRPFDSVDEMNRELVARWNDAVADGDTITVIGDLALGKLRDSLALASQLRGVKFLVPGNHDRCWPGHRKARSADTQAYTDAGFSILAPETETRIGGHTVAVCHLPYVGDSHDEDRFDDWRPSDHGRWLVHGHVHEKWRVHDRMINVGVDQWNFTPVSSETLTKIINARDEVSTPR